MSSARGHRPVFLNLFRMRYPIGAIASIGHRISGIVLAVSLPFMVAAFDHSIESEQAYRQIAAALRGPLGVLAAPILCWALAHHVLAGIRHLLMDVGVGATLPVARRTAWTVIVAGAFLAAILVGGLLS